LRHLLLIVNTAVSLAHRRAEEATVAMLWSAGRIYLTGIVNTGLVIRNPPPRAIAAGKLRQLQGAALMTVPGPAILAVIGMITLGLAAAPVFPLFTLTTADRLGTADVAGTSRTVSLQVAASAVGGTALLAVLGLAIGAAGASILAPLLLVLGLAMCGVYGIVARLSGRPPG
jgi:hypothetical protein